MKKIFKKIKYISEQLSVPVNIFIVTFIILSIIGIIVECSR